jgi:hypothetical protein
MMSVSKVGDSYQADLKDKDKLARKQNQRNRGGNSSRGKGTTKEKSKKPKHEARKKHNHPEKVGSSRKGKRGGRRYFPRGRGRDKGGEFICYSSGKTGNMSWECLKRKKDTKGG